MVDRMLQPLDVAFAATISDLPHDANWIHVVWPDSVEFFGSTKAVKVVGFIDDAPLATAFMPDGRGGQFLPVSAKLRKAIGKDVGDDVVVRLTGRY